MPPADAASDSDAKVPVSPPRPLLAASRRDDFAVSPARSLPGFKQSPSAAKSESLAGADGSDSQPQALHLQNGHLAAVPTPAPFDMFGNQTQQARGCAGTRPRLCHMPCTVGQDAAWVTGLGHDWHLARSGLRITSVCASLACVGDRSRSSSAPLVSSSCLAQLRPSC